MAKTVYLRTNRSSGEEEVFDCFTAIPRKIRGTLTKEAFNAQLAQFEQPDFVWTQVTQPLPIKFYHCGEGLTVDDQPWWDNWTAEPTPSSTYYNKIEESSTLELRQDIYERNYGIRVGIARDNWQHQDELFDHPTTEVPETGVRGIRIDDGINIWETSLWELIDELHVCLNYTSLRAMLDGTWLSCKLGDAAKDALKQYLSLFALSSSFPSVEYVTGKTIPIEEYNRFGEIIMLYPNAATAAKAYGLTPKTMRAKLCSWDDSSRTQFRYARTTDAVSTNAEKTYPIEQTDGHEVINRFATLEEAASILGYSKSVIGRWVQSGEEDNFGYFWRRKLR